MEFQKVPKAATTAVAGHRLICPQASALRCSRTGTLHPTTMFTAVRSSVARGSVMRAFSTAKNPSVRGLACSAVGQQADRLTITRAVLFYLSAVQQTLLFAMTTIKQYTTVANASTAGGGYDCAVCPGILRCQQRTIRIATTRVRRKTLTSFQRGTAD